MARFLALATACMLMMVYLGCSQSMPEATSQMSATSNDSASTTGSATTTGSARETTIAPEATQSSKAMTAEQLQESLQGKWTITRSVYDGRNVPTNAGGQDSGLYFQASTLELRGSVIDQPLACKYDVATLPYRLIMQAEFGAPYLQGIVEVNGNTLRLCYRMHAQKDLGFPENFESKAGSGLMFLEATKSAP